MLLQHVGISQTPGSQSQWEFGLPWETQTSSFRVFLGGQSKPRQEQSTGGSVVPSQVLPAVQLLARWVFLSMGTISRGILGGCYPPHHGCDFGESRRISSCQEVLRARSSPAGQLDSPIRYPSIAAPSGKAPLGKGIGGDAAERWGSLGTQHPGGLGGGVADGATTMPVGSAAPRLQQGADGCGFTPPSATGRRGTPRGFPFPQVTPLVPPVWGGRVPSIPPTAIARASPSACTASCFLVKTSSSRLIVNVFY